LGIDVVNLNIIPFRFDDARNAALSHIPHDIDYCLSLDLDEVVFGDLHEAFQTVPREVTRLKYPFVHRWNPDGTAARTHIASKIHARSGYRWINPVHEMLTNYSGEELEHNLKIEIHHHPDDSKSRSSYLDLLEIACKEQKDSSQLHFWLGREYLIHGRKEQAIDGLKFFLEKFPEAWGPEIAFAQIYLGDLVEKDRLYYLELSVKTAPYLRETWLKLADFYLQNKDWEKCRTAALEASKLTFKPEIYLVDLNAWVGPKCYDLIALCSHFLGENLKAIEYGEKALDLNPDDNRLRNNLSAYRRTLATQISSL
jgi:tetratricopeptide (TPR) repeat protein